MTNRQSRALRTTSQNASRMRRSSSMARAVRAFASSSPRPRPSWPMPMQMTWPTGGRRAMLRSRSRRRPANASPCNPGPGTRPEPARRFSGSARRTTRSHTYSWILRGSARRSRGTVSMSRAKFIPPPREPPPSFFPSRFAAYIAASAATSASPPTRGALGRDRPDARVTRWSPSERQAGDQVHELQRVARHRQTRGLGQDPRERHHRGARDVVVRQFSRIPSDRLEHRSPALCPPCCSPPGPSMSTTRRPNGRP